MINWFTQCTNWLLALIPTYVGWLEASLELTFRDLIAVIGVGGIWGSVIQIMPSVILDTPLISILLFASVPVTLVYCGISMVKWIVGVFT